MDTAIKTALKVAFLAAGIGVVVALGLFVFAYDVIDIEGNYPELWAKIYKGASYLVHYLKIGRMLLNNFLPPLAVDFLLAFIPVNIVYTFSINMAQGIMKLIAEIS